MKRYLSVAVTFALIFMFTISCKAEKSEGERMKGREKIIKTMNVPAGVKPDVYIDYLAWYGPEWDDYKIKSGKAFEVFKDYFNDVPFRVIWHWDIDGDGYNDYLGVEVYPEARRGIKRGVLVDEKGEIKLYIDTLKGVYTKDEVLLDLIKMGHFPGEVECFAIGYIPYLGKGKFSGSGVGASPDDIRKILKKYKNTRIVLETIGTFTLQRFDKDLHNIGSDYIDNNAQYRLSDGFFIGYDLIKNKAVFELFDYGFMNSDEVHQKKKFLLERNRQAKKNGSIFRPPKELNEKDIKKALEIETGLDSW